MGFCLPKEFANKFIQSLKDGTIDINKMSDMTSVERRDFLTKIVGETDAKEVNALFESKLLLKDQKRGLVSWAKKVAGITEPVRRDLLAKIEKMDKILSPETEQAFLEDLASSKLGVDVTLEEANTIMQKSKALQDARDAIKSDEPAGSPDRLKYGAAKVALANYVDELKLTAQKQTLKEAVTEGIKTPIKSIEYLAGTAKGIKASLDDSALFRQGWKTLFTNPSVWAENAVKSFSDIARQLKVPPDNSIVLDGIKADIYSRPNALNNLYQKMKLDVGIEYEEAFPSTLPERLPLFGRLYKASEVAYQGFLYRMRADIADRYIEIAKETGVDLNNKNEVRSIGKLVNSLTGRGDLGSLEKIGKEVNTVFFSPKMLKSSFDFLTAHQLQRDVTPFVRKQAAVNLLKVITGMAAILGVAKALNPQSVELDPRSADFGKIRIKDTRFDVSGGMSSLVTLAARLIKNSSKSSTSGKISELNTGKYGALTSSDVVVNFFENKLSPAAAILKDLLNRTDYKGDPITLQGELTNLLVPLPVTNVHELMTNPNSANILVAEMADALGIVTNTYSAR